MTNEPTGLLADAAFVALGRRILAGKCSLFLGAGASIDSGASSTQVLADLLAETVLMTDARGMDLGDVVDYIDGSVGRRAATQAIVDRLRNLEPHGSLLTLASLPWKAAYTSNYDTLMDQAFESVHPGGSQPVVSARDLDTLRPDVMPIYHIHGSIAQANDPQMGLVLTHRDLIRSRAIRQAFYRRLTDDLSQGEVVYIGFSLGDSDFRSVIVEMHDAVDNRQELVPRGYAVMRNPPPFAAGYWDGQKVSLIAASLEDFVTALAQLRAGTSGVAAIPIGQSPLLPKFLRDVNPASGTAYDITYAFDFPEFDEGDADPSTFLHGAPPSWPTIRARFDAYRDITEPMLDWLIVSPGDEPIGPRRSATQVGLVSGHAGSGKTTLARRLAWALVHDWSQLVVWCRNPGRLQFDVVETVTALAKTRLYIFIDDAVDAAFQVSQVIERSRRRGLRVTFVVVDRENEWTAATRDHPVDLDRDFALSSLTNGEALGLLGRLKLAGELGSLAGKSQDEQVRILVERAGRDLLVGLREATNDERRFDEILQDEYAQLPTDSAKRAYSTVCTLFQFGVASRAGILSRTTGVPFDQFGPAILQPSKHVILEAQDQPWEQPRYVARHRVIADVIFRRAFPSSSERSIQIQSLLQHLDPGYRDDARAFTRLINARWLRDRVTDEADQEAIYAAARRLRPEDPFVIQQHALAWRRRDRSYAARMLHEAEAVAPNNEAIKHSQAVLLLDDAKEATGPERTRLLANAEDAFSALRAREPQNATPYVSLAAIALIRSADAEDPADKLAHVARADKILSDAFRRAPASSYLMEMAGRVEEAAGQLGDADASYLAAARGAGPEPHVWISYAKFLSRHAGPEAAIRALEEALDLNPIESQLNHAYALALEKATPQNDVAIRKAYSVAMAEPVRGHLPELDFAIFLHASGASSEAETHFQSLRASDLPSRIKSTPRRWIESDGKRKVIRARIVDIGHTKSYVETPDLDGRIFVHTRDLPADRRVGATIDVYVHYNCYGPRAVPVSAEVPVPAVSTVPTDRDL